MKITITTSYNENDSIHHVARKFTELCGTEATNTMLEESKKYGFKAENIPCNEGTYTTIIIPDKVVHAVTKIIAKMINFINILKPIVINFFEDISEEFDSLEDLKVDDDSNESNHEIQE